MDDMALLVFVLIAAGFVVFALVISKKERDLQLSHAEEHLRTIFRLATLDKDGVDFPTLLATIRSQAKRGIHPRA